ncbi:GNAT family N-acetyltransferase [Effusibacillus consociatus]|uniref:GNAT family N-acetyltransferase n=1 Tax=Effusibacillus consociatus TaxID=1117041 RepID=A0ABV9Q1R4_9BACL
MIELRELGPEHADVLHRLLRISRTGFDGYLAEEVLGWSISRLVCLGDQIVGLIQVRKLDSEKAYGVLGTWLVPQVWGTGVNQAAKEAMLRLVFEERTDVDRVYFCIEEENVRSLRAAEKLRYVKKIGEEDVPCELVDDLRDVSGTQRRWYAIMRESFIRCG